jgi:glycerol-3-phosphate dehydrogenase
MQPVVIAGAGINGAAVARDLALNGVPSLIVDSGDIAQGATSRSSRLIHGGLRYLEYRDLTLVRESLAERERLLRTAPQFVRPLRLSISVRQRFGGLCAAAVRFSGLARTRFGAAVLRCCHSPRGLFAIRFGLWLYDLLASGSSLPRHSTTRSTDEVRGWQCSYWDAQLEFPERFVLSLLHDAQSAANRQGVDFRVLTRHQLRMTDSGVLIEPVSHGQTHGASTNSESAATLAIQPTLIINATGAWGDLTLQSLGNESESLFAGTRGSHLFSTHEPLRRAVGSDGIYAEAHDGRLVFILPLGGGVLIGTTDLPHTGSPATAVATDDETAYLIAMTNSVLPDVGLGREHIEVRHAGVRPLPRTQSRSTAAIPRGHSIHWSTVGGIPVATLIGGKLTTCRQLGEEVTDAVLERLSRRRTQSTVDRPLPGSDTASDGRPARDDASGTGPKNSFDLSPEQVQTIQRLAGNRVREICTTPEFSVGGDGTISVCGTTIPRGFVRWSIAREWAASLNDLIERRLMLIFEPNLRRSTLTELAGLLIKAERLAPEQQESEIERCIASLETFQGRRVLPERR